jgi:glycosyltransferase involved in cell wall biosynthesis
MTTCAPLVSIGLPVRNAGAHISAVIDSVLAQDHPNIELVISDNASTDDTASISHAAAGADPRVRYHRQSVNIGLLNNFQYVLANARGEYFRWIGDDDRLAPDLISECLRVFATDPRLILVTTAIAYTTADRQTRTAPYLGTALGSDDPVERLAEMLRLLNESHLLIDPLYGLLRRAAVRDLPRRNMLREDEVYAAKLALAGPWAHVPRVLAHRGWKPERVSTMARRLGVPGWQAHLSNTLQCRELLRAVAQAPLRPGQRSAAASAVLRMYLRRQQRTVSHRGRKLARLVLARTDTLD